MGTPPSSSPDPESEIPDDGAADGAAAAPGDDGAVASGTGSKEARAQLWRNLAVILGLLSALCAVAYPFLPVAQDTAKILWPAKQDTRPVNAPLTGYWAQDMQVNMPCGAIQSLDHRSPGGGLLFSTVPPQRAQEGAGMQLRVDKGVLNVLNRGQQVIKQPLPASGCDVHVASDAGKTQVTVGGVPVFPGDGDIRPRVVGIYSDVTADKDPIAGMSVQITPDTRFQSSPTVWKIIDMIVGVAAFAGCMVALYRLDTRVARRPPQ